MSLDREWCTLFTEGPSVLDLHGTPIPGLYACGDSSGGFGQHGLCRAATYGRLGGWHAAQQALSDNAVAAASQRRVRRPADPV